MKLSRNSNNLNSGSLSHLLRHLGSPNDPDPVPVPVPVPEKKAEVKVPPPAASQALDGHKVSGAHHNSGVMGTTGWQSQGGTLDQMLKRLKKA